MDLFIGGHFQAHIERTRKCYPRAELYQWTMLAVVAVLAVFLGAEVVRSAGRARDDAAARQAAEAAHLAKSASLATMESGRASCRGRVGQAVSSPAVADYLKNTKSHSPCTFK